MLFFFLRVFASPLCSFLRLACDGVQLHVVPETKRKGERDSVFAFVFFPSPLNCYQKTNHFLPSIMFPFFSAHRKIAAGLLFAAIPAYAFIADVSCFPARPKNLKGLLARLFHPRKERSPPCAPMPLSSDSRLFSRPSFLIVVWPKLIGGVSMRGYSATMLYVTNEELPCYQQGVTTIPCYV